MAMEALSVPTLTAPLPIHLIVYHLPPPPPGCLYAFSTFYNGRSMPLQIMPLATAEPFIPLCQTPLLFHPYYAQQDNLIGCSKLSTSSFNLKNVENRVDSKSIHHGLTYNGPSAAVCEDNIEFLSGSGKDAPSADWNNRPAAPSSEDGLVANSFSIAEKQASKPVLGEAQRDEFGITDQRRLSEATHDRPAALDAAADSKPSRFWCSNGVCIHQLSAEVGNSVVKWGENASSSCNSGVTLDEAIAQNKRFNKTPSFRNKKYVRTSSRNGCLWKSGRRVDIAPESSGSSCGPTAGMPQRTSSMKHEQHRITVAENWRVRENPKKMNDRSDVGVQSSILQPGKDGDVPNIGDMINLMRSFSFGLKS